MALFKKIFGKKEAVTPKGFYRVNVSDKVQLTQDAYQISFDIPDEVANEFQFKAGQYIVLAVDIKGSLERRSYSLCSSPHEPLSIGVKTVEGGKVSTYLNNELKVGDEIMISRPEGNFTLGEDERNIVAIAAGSGITPILSIAKSFQGDGSFRLFYGNRKESDIMFKADLDKLDKVFTDYYLSREEKEGFAHGRINKESFSKVIQSDLSILRSDVFMICGPEEMVLEIKDQLKMFGVNENKIRFELFSPPKESAEIATEDVADFKGTSQVTIQLDGVSETIVIPSGKMILEEGIEAGLDLPYSCKGGVCSTCKAKVLEGKVRMKINYSLTDREVADGYILSCQSIPASEKIKITYDV